MTIKYHLDRPGIQAVCDTDELNSIAGGAGGATPGDAELNAFLENKWVSIAGGILYAFYLYGDANNRLRVRNVCRQFARGVNNAGRDSLNIIYRGIAGVTSVASWIRNYFTGAANTTATAVDSVCLDP